MQKTDSAKEHYTGERVPAGMYICTNCRYVIETGDPCFSLMPYCPCCEGTHFRECERCLAE